MSEFRIAVTKGRLEKAASRMFSSIGYDCSALEKKGRKLIVPLGGGVQAVLAKAPDVITYVEHGVCDAGIVGKDTIMEHGHDFYEVVDLGFGKCRFALAGPKNAGFYEGYSRKRIATKYPKVAREFFDGKGMDVEIIKITGSVELAPILGLADAIVDIVETGATLRENGLKVIEYICMVSARLIINTSSMKLKKNYVDGFVSRIKNLPRKDVRS